MRKINTITTEYSKHLYFKINDRNIIAAGAQMIDYADPMIVLITPVGRIKVRELTFPEMTEIINMEKDEFLKLAKFALKSGLNVSVDRDDIDTELIEVLYIKFYHGEDLPLSIAVYLSEKEEQVEIAYPTSIRERYPPTTICVIRGDKRLIEEGKRLLGVMKRYITYEGAYNTAAALKALDEFKEEEKIFIEKFLSKEVINEVTDEFHGIMSGEKTYGNLIDKLLRRGLQIDIILHNEEAVSLIYL